MLWRFAKDQEGAALVEMAIALPLALIVFAGLVEIGRGLEFHHTLNKSVRDVARYMARWTPMDETVPDEAMATALMNPEVTCPTVKRTPPCRLLDPGTVQDVRFDAARLAAGVVRIEAAVQYQFPLLSLILMNPTMTFTVAHEQPLLGER